VLEKHFVKSLKGIEHPFGFVITTPLTGSYEHVIFGFAAKTFTLKIIQSDEKNITFAFGTFNNIFITFITTPN
jgi:hypothetical protein